jgi:hypothetical protein
MEKKLLLSPEEEPVPSRVVTDSENKDGSVCASSGIYEAGTPSPV